LQEKAAEQSAIEITLAQPLRDPPMPEAVIAKEGRHVTVRSRQPARTLVELVKWLDHAGYELEDVRLHRPTLEDVFIEMTGKRLRE
jgi:ABC-2 type transport system ATP-binding protein